MRLSSIIMSTGLSHRSEILMMCGPELSHYVIIEDNHNCIMKLYPLSIPLVSSILYREAYRQPRKQIQHWYGAAAWTQIVAHPIS